jgi:transcription antitermination factor NusA-like protein
MQNDADLQGLRQQQQSGYSNAPADPFPSLNVQDPFPSSAAAPPQAAIGTSNGNVQGNGHVAGTSAKTRGSSQPDFESEDLFPALGASASSAKGKWGQKPASSMWSAAAPVIQRTVHQEVLSIPASEETSAKLAQIIQRVQSKHRDINVQASTTRKMTTFVIKGNDASSVKAAKRELTVGLARNVTLTLTIPASLQGYVIGQKGKNLKNITEQTGARIDIAKPEGGQESAAARRAGGDIDYENDEQIQVTIEGDEINARTAQDMLNAIVAERTSRTTQRLSHIDHIYYPFIAGPKNSNVTYLEQTGDVTVKIPPRAAFLPAREGAETNGLKRERDLSIIVSGDRDAVAKVVQTIDSQVEGMRHSFRTLQISIPKRQHRFLVGDAAQDILASTQCSIELAPIDDPSDNVTIRGPQSNLPSGLTLAMSKANAVRVEVVDVGAAHRDVEHAKALLRWLSRSGKIPREQDVQVYLPRSAIVESSGLVHIEVVGAQSDAVSRVREEVDSHVKRVPPTFVTTVDVDPLLHRFVIGKKAANLTQYAKKGVDVIFPPPPDSENTEGVSEVLLVLGDAAVIATLPAEKKAREQAAQSILAGVKADIENASKNAADLKSETLAVPSKFHRAILGPNGTTLNAILGEERLVAVKLGSSNSNASGAKPDDENTVVVRGPSTEVSRVTQAIQQIVKEAEEDAIVNGHTVEMSVNSQYVPHLVGRGGAGVTKLREELGVKIDFGDANAAEGAKKATSKVSVTIVGRKENVLEAQKRILGQVDKLADETSVTLKVPANLRGAVIGQGGKYVTRLQDSYGVRINFPSASAAEDAKASGQAPDEVVIKGGKKGVEAARVELLELIEYEKENNNVVQLPVSTKSIARIMGRGGANVNRIREETEAQIDVDKDEVQGGAETTMIRLRGTKKAIAAAKTAILSVVDEVNAEQSFSVHIPARYHGQVIGPGGQNLRDIIARAGGDAESKSATQLIQFPRRGAEQTDEVSVRGPAQLAVKIKAELERIATELQNRIVIGVSVPVSQHRSLMGRIRELQSVHSNARIVVPGWREYDGLEISNANDVATAAPNSIVKIQGPREVCEALRMEIGESFASNSYQVDVPRAVAAKLAGGSIVRRLRTDFGVSVDAPKLADKAASNVSKPASGAARIDDEPGTVESLPYEVNTIDLSSSSDTVSWGLSGRSSASVKDAAQELEAEIRRMQSFNTQARLWVDQRAIPRIVGRGGAGLRDIEAQNEVNIDVPRDQGGLVIILGTQDAVEDARQRIAQIALRGGRE